MILFKKLIADCKLSSSDNLVKVLLLYSGTLTKYPFLIFKRNLGKFKSVPFFLNDDETLSLVLSVTCFPLCIDDKIFLFH